MNIKCIKCGHGYSLSMPRIQKKGLEFYQTNYVCRKCLLTKIRDGLNNIALGIEIEAGFNAGEEEFNKLRKICKKHNWEIKNDGSITARNSGNTAKELVSGVIEVNYSNENPLRDVNKQLDDLIIMITEVNKSMGFHLHISFKDFYCYNLLYSKQFITFFRKKLKAKYKDNEILQNRFKNNYCSGRYNKTDFDGIDRIRTRYKMINFLAYSRHKTIEFRVFDVNKDLMKDYIKTTLELVDEFLLKKLKELEKAGGVATEEINLDNIDTTTNITEEILEEKKVIVI